MAKTKVLLSIDRELLDRVDEMAELVNMDRSEFICAFLDITMESQKPVIHFGKALGKLKAAALWPKFYRVSVR